MTTPTDTESSVDDRVRALRDRIKDIPPKPAWRTHAAKVADERAREATMRAGLHEATAVIRTAHRRRPQDGECACVWCTGDHPALQD